MSNNDSNSNKRRRYDDDLPAQVPSAVPSAVPSSVAQPATITDADDADADADLGLVVPALDEVPRLVMEDLLRENEDDVATAIATLSNLLAVKNNPNGLENRGKARCIGAPSIVLVAMRKFQRNETIQLNGCSCIANLLYDHEIGEARASVVTIGGIETITNIVKRFHSQESVADNGIRALTNLFYKLRSASEVVKGGADRFINDLGGLDMLLKAMTTRPENAMLQRFCCRIFKDFTYKSEFRDVIRKAGAVTMVAIALDNHADDEAIKKRASAFMKAMFT